MWGLHRPAQASAPQWPPKCCHIRDPLAQIAKSQRGPVLRVSPGRDGVTWKRLLFLLVVQDEQTQESEKGSILQSPPFIPGRRYQQIFGLFSGPPLVGTSMKLKPGLSSGGRTSALWGMGVGEEWKGWNALQLSRQAGSRKLSRSGSQWSGTQDRGRAWKECDSLGAELQEQYRVSLSGKNTSLKARKASRGTPWCSGLAVFSRGSAYRLFRAELSLRGTGMLYKEGSHPCSPPALLLDRGKR